MNHSIGKTPIEPPMIHIVISKGYPIAFFEEMLRGVPRSNIRYVRNAQELMGVDLAGKMLVTLHHKHVVPTEDAHSLRVRLIESLR